MNNGIQLRSFNEVMELSRDLIKAKGFIPESFKNENEVFAVILKGIELGLGPMEALNGLYMYKGRVGIHYDLMVTLMRRQLYKIEWLQTDDKVAEVRLTAPDGIQFPLKYTIEQARNAGIAHETYQFGNAKGKPTMWGKYPEVMLRARCIMAAARSFVGGMSCMYSHDEMQEIERTEKVVEVPASPVSGNETLLSALSASDETIAVIDEPKEPPDVQQCSVHVDNDIESDEFVKMRELIKTSISKRDIVARGLKIKCSKTLAEDEKETLREIYANKMADMEAKEDE